MPLAFTNKSSPLEDPLRSQRQDPDYMLSMGKNFTDKQQIQYNLIFMYKQVCIT